MVAALDRATSNVGDTMSRGSGPVWRIVEALLRVPQLNELSERNLVTRILGDAWGTPFPVDEQPRAVGHLFSLVDVCLRRPHGLRSLAEALDNAFPEDIHLTEVHRAIDAMTVLEMWPADERDQLFALLDGIAISDLDEVYQAAAGRGTPALRPKATCREAFAMLETRATGPDGVPPAIVFVELLATIARPDLATRLRQWSERQARLMDLTVELIAARQRPPLVNRHTEPARPLAYIVLLVTPEGLDGHTYRLSHWYQLDRPDAWLPDRGSDFCGDLDDVRHAVAHLTESLEADWAAHQPTISVEFVLPEELLNLAVDQWEWETDPRMPEPIGCHFPVVIRSLDRMTHPQWHRPWYQRWERLQEQLTSDGAIAPTSGYWSKSGDAGSIRAIMSAFEREPTLVALVPSTPPQARTYGAEEVAAGFRKGVPVMVWHRTNCRSAEFVTAVRDMLHGHDPHDVLERVRLLRLSGFVAGTDGRHVGNSLTVLWDDPARRVTPGRAAPPAAWGAA